MERVKSDQSEIVKAALDMLTNEIRSSTSSMTAVPKPLKFLRAHRNDLVETHARMAHGPNKVRMLWRHLHRPTAAISLHSELEPPLEPFPLLNSFFAHFGYATLTTRSDPVLS